MCTRLPATGLSTKRAHSTHGLEHILTGCPLALVLHYSRDKHGEFDHATNDGIALLLLKVCPLWNLIEGSIE